VFTRARQAAILAMLAGVFGSTRLLAGERDCSSPAVEADADVGARWPDLRGRIRAALGGRGDVDACARITIRAAEGGLVVVVVLPDGRRASRVVARADDVVPTLQALLLLPRAEAEVRTANAANTADEATPAVAPGPTPVVAARAPAAIGAADGALGESDRLRLEFSLVAGGRAGDGEVGFSVGALTLFDVAGWLLGFEAAGSGYQRVAGGAGGSALIGAIVGGRRIWLHDVALDLMAGPALALRGIGRSVVVARMADGSMSAPPPADDGPWARLVCGARVTFRARSVIRTFAGVDGELALARRPTDEPNGDARLPAWTVGAVVGVTVGSR
jgi:hypothetical protein